MGEYNIYIKKPSEVLDLGLLQTDWLWFHESVFGVLFVVFSFLSLEINNLLKETDPSQIKIFIICQKIHNMLRSQETKQNCIGSTYTWARAKNLNVYSLVSCFARLTKQVNCKRLTKQKNVSVLVCAPNHMERSLNGLQSPKSKEPIVHHHNLSSQRPDPFLTCSSTGNTSS